MRELLASAVSSSHLESQEFECDCDRLGAMAFGPRLGSLLFRIREGGQPKWRREAAIVLGARLRRRVRLDPYLAIKIAAAALLEWERPHCRACNGAREIQAAHLKIVCPVCEGVGVHRWSDRERKKLIGGIGGLIDQGLIEAHVIISGAVGSLTATAREQLERT